MIRRPPRRALHALVAMVFLLSGAVDLSGVRPCPHHGLPAAAAEHPSADHPHREHDGEAGSTPRAGQEVCTCKRVCPGVPATSLPVAAPPVGAQHAEASGTVLLAGVDAAVPRLIPFFLPYAQAPPSLG